LAAADDVFGPDMFVVDLLGDVDFVDIENINSTAGSRKTVCADSNNASNVKRRKARNAKNRGSY
jgi:hypothetical protein